MPALWHMAIHLRNAGLMNRVGLQPRKVNRGNPGVLRMTRSTEFDSPLYRMSGKSLPDGWHFVPLATVADINPRRPAGRVRGDHEPTTFVPMAAVDERQGVIVAAETKPYAAVKKGYTYFAEGDVLFAKITPCMQNGKHAIAEGLIDGIGFGTTEFHVIRPGANLASEWAHFYLRQPEVLRAATAHFTGAVGQQRVPPGFLSTLLIPLPPLAEQKRIAGILKEQLAAVERARAAAQAQLEAAQALPAAYLREVFEGEHTRSWESRRLGELMTRFNDIIHPGDRAEGDAVFVGLEHVESNTGRRIGSLTLNLGSLTGRKPTFKKGQIVYGYLRPYLNKVWIAEFDGCSSVDQFAFEVHRDVADVTFVAAFMRSDTFLRRSAAVTTTGQLPRISIDEILAVRIDVPPTVAEQARIASNLSARLGHATTLVQNCQSQLADITALPAALLRAAFQGQL